jgi:DNA-binding GntR family transcriptional regulator
MPRPNPDRDAERSVGPTPLRGDATFERMYTTLRRRIALLDHPPGALLSENKLAAEFGVSRTPIRKVLHALEFDGLVEIAPGVGTIVTPLDLRYLKQVYALRLKLIDLIGELPLAVLSDADAEVIDALRQRALVLRDADPDPRALAELYLDFHGTLLRVIANRPLREISDRYFVQTSRMWLQLLPEMDWTSEVDTLLEELTEVTAALRDRDGARVADVRRAHFRAVLQRMNAVLAGDDLVGGILAREGVVAPE